MTENEVRIEELEHPGGVIIGCADGYARFIREETPLAILKALLTKAGDETFNFEDLRPFL